MATMAKSMQITCAHYKLEPLLQMGLKQQSAHKRTSERIVYFALSFHMQITAAATTTIAKATTTMTMTTLHSVEMVFALHSPRSDRCQPLDLLAFIYHTSNLMTITMMTMQVGAKNKLPNNETEMTDDE